MSRDVSSVGLERCFDRAEVTGSSPVRPTNFGLSFIVQLYEKKALSLKYSSYRTEIINAKLLP